MCRMGAANLSALKPAFDELGVTMIGIGVEMIGFQDFVEGGYFTGELFIDEKKECYTALSCIRNTWRNLWGLMDKDILRIFDISKKKGYANNLAGDKNQLGGTFVLGPKDGKTMYGHYQTPKSFEPSLVGIMESLKIPIPEGYDPYAAQMPPTKVSKSKE